MKLLILISFLFFLICFPANSEEKRPEIKEKEQYRVNFTFLVANQSGSLDDLHDYLIASKKSKLSEMEKEKLIQHVRGKDKLKIEKVHSRILGKPFVEARLMRNGRNIGKVYVFTDFLYNFCDQIH